MKPALHAERPLREWPLEQLAEQAALHAADVDALAALALETRHRRGARAKALEARLARMIAACAAADAAPPAAELGRLRATLAAAAREIVALRARLAAAQAAHPRHDPAPDRAEPLRRVHLTADAPAWLIAEVRRAYRRRYHPDAAADQQNRRRAEEVFKRAEAVFAAIERRPGS